ncbi:hypothetical protein [Kosakonia sacchari]|nr:hypothetical protein [Kosakonia sacchari]
MSRFACHVTVRSKGAGDRAATQRSVEGVIEGEYFSHHFFAAELTV